MIENFTPQPYPLWASWLYDEDGGPTHYGAGLIVGWTRNGDRVETPCVSVEAGHLGSDEIGSFWVHDSPEAAVTDARRRAERDGGALDPDLPALAGPSGGG